MCVAFQFAGLAEEGAYWIQEPERAHRIHGIMSEGVIRMVARHLLRIAHRAVLDDSK